MASAPPSRFITTLGHFRDLRFVRRGGIADIYRAQDVRRGQEYKAIKLVRRVEEHTQEILEAERRGAFIQERLAARCPAVPRVLDHEELDHEDYVYYIEMTWLDGNDLDKLLRNRKFSELQAVYTAQNICKLLVEVHTPRPLAEDRRGYVIHGDIKPDNIRETSNGLCLLDFGCAQEVPEGGTPQPIAFYAPQYVSPERIAKGIVRAQDDLWAAAVILYEMTTGERPWDGDDNSVKQAILTRNPGALPEDCSEGLEAFLRRALHRHPQRRFQSANEMVVGLEDLKEQLTRSHHRSDAPADSRGSSLARLQETDESVDLGDSDFNKAVPPPAPVGRLEGLPRELLHILLSPASMIMGSSQGRFVIFAAICMLLIFQFVVGTRAVSLAERLQQAESPNLELVWQDYENLDPFWGFGWSGRLLVRAKVRDVMIKAADEIIEQYEVSLPSTDISWITAESYLKHATKIGASRREDARLAYVRGHIHRIESRNLAANKLDEQAAIKLREAISLYREAAYLAPDWHSPYLGLAPVYAYFAPDLTKLEETIVKGRERRAMSGVSHTPYKNRETAQLADLHRRLCNDEWNRAQSLLDQERINVLQFAKQHCSTSIKLYDRIPNFGFAGANRKIADSKLQRIRKALR